MRKGTSKTARRKPAFPVLGGLTFSAYAAIHLRVADSGIGWLDEMILKSNRQEFAKSAMLIIADHEILSNITAREIGIDKAISQACLDIADAMAAELKIRPSSDAQEKTTP